MKQDMIVILDLGSTENTKLARDIREMGVYSEIYPHDITASELKELPNVKGIIINGGPNNVVDGTPIDVRPELYEAGYGKDSLRVRQYRKDSHVCCDRRTSGRNRVCGRYN